MLRQLPCSHWGILRVFITFIKCNKNINKVYSAISSDASIGTMSEKEQWLISNYVLENDMSLTHQLKMTYSITHKVNPAFLYGYLRTEACPVFRFI
jgi:hypothetical protein